MAGNAFLARLGKQKQNRTVVETENGTTAFIQGGAIMEIPLDQIEEDPNQPRSNENVGFSEEVLQGLADSIAANGLLQPISVHKNPDKDGFFIINHGARRFRAMKLTGADKIKAIVDEDFNEQKQLIENLQRENLSLAEIVQSLATIKTRFKTATELAKAVGKSNAWVSQMLALSKLPPSLQTLLNEGKCQDQMVLIGLNKLIEEHPAEVADFIEEGILTRTALKALQQEIDDQKEAEAAARATEDEAESTDSEEEERQGTPQEFSTAENVNFSTAENSDEVDSGDVHHQHETDVRDEENDDHAAASADEDDAEEAYEDEEVIHSSGIITFQGRRAHLVLNKPIEIVFEDTGERSAVYLTPEEI